MEERREVRKSESIRERKTRRLLVILFAPALVLILWAFLSDEMFLDVGTVPVSFIVLRIVVLSIIFVSGIRLMIKRWREPIAR